MWHVHAQHDVLTIPSLHPDALQCCSLRFARSMMADALAWVPSGTTPVAMPMRTRSPTTSRSKGGDQEQEQQG